MSQLKTSLLKSSLTPSKTVWQVLSSYGYEQMFSLHVFFKKQLPFFTIFVHCCYLPEAFYINKQFLFTQTITNNQFYSGGSTRIFVWRPLYVSNTRVGDSMRTFLSFLSSLWNTFGGQINKYIEIIGSLYCLCSKIRGFAPQRDFYLNKLPL